MAPHAAVLDMPEREAPAEAPITGPHVYTAISQVTADLAAHGISKGRENKQQGYAFRGIDDVYNVLSRVLANHKLVVLPRMLTRVCVERTAKSGSAQFFVTVEAEFDLVSAIDGSCHTVRTFGEAQDSGDKATNKAMSAAYKYAAFQTFCIPTEGDNDADATTAEPSVPAVPFDEAGYAEWLNNLSLGVEVGKLDALIVTIKQGPQAFQDALRADKVNWTRLKALTEAK